MILKPQITYKQINTYSDRVATLVTKLCEEIKYDYNKQDIENSLQKLFASPDFLCVGAYKGKILVGVLAVFFAQELYNYSKITAHEQFWYVLPEYRKGVGLQLVKHVENKLNGVTIEFGIANESLQRLLQLNGYQIKKTLMFKGL